MNKLPKTVRTVAFSRPGTGLQEAIAAADVVKSGWIVGGPRLLELEKAFASTCNTKFAIGASSWTTAAFLVLKALGIGPGDEVIVPSLTFIASVNVIRHVGATPVFVDVDEGTYNICPDKIEALIGDSTKAILPIDQLGLPCEIDKIQAIADKHNLLVIQDAACSIGSRFRDRPTGCGAPVAIFSLHARKVVTTGEGGMIVTSDERLAKKLRLLRHQGMSLSDYERHGSLPTKFEEYPEIGYNFRLTDIQAAIGVVQMSRLNAMLERRNWIAQAYIKRLSHLKNLQMPAVPAHIVPNWQSFQLCISKNSGLGRNEVMEKLHARGVATRRGVMASHLEPPYRGYRADLPVTQDLAKRSFQLPIFPDMSDEEIEYVILAVEQVAA